jgi:hypothetical protein
LGPGLELVLIIGDRRAVVGRQHGVIGVGGLVGLATVAALSGVSSVMASLLGRRPT